MCLFITAVLPRDARSSEFEALVARHKLSFQPCTNPHVLAVLKPTEQYTLGTLADCDCGSPLFFGATERSANKIEAEARRLRKKGWTEAKIARWIESTGPRPHQPGEWRAYCWSVPQWADFLNEALALPRVAYIGLLGHHYRGDVDTESFEVKGRVSHTVRELRHGALDCDVIHDFRSTAPGNPLGEA